MNYFTADTHFMGKLILIRENRPFDDEYKFIDYIVNLWNKQADKNDIIYHLGDFTNFNGSENNPQLALEGLSVVKNINANVVLIIGNNEERIIKNLFNDDFDYFKKFCINLGFKDVLKEKYIKLYSQDVYLNHYPKNHKKDLINLFGHTHRITGLWKPYGLNMGCDLNHFFLYTEYEINRILQEKIKYWDDDIDVLNL